MCLLCLCFSLTDRVASGAKRRSLTSACGSRGRNSLLTRYCFSLISLGTYALRLCLVCVVDVRVRPRSSVGILEEALDLTVDLCTALFLHRMVWTSPLGPFWVTMSLKHTTQLVWHTMKTPCKSTSAMELSANRGYMMMMIEKGPLSGL